ncbi:histidine kinase [Chitinophaga agrisoli]|uniref:Histidine kinase n=2 Tax=Chitinophaga agrisoli TaxID=2607653 RepID=A0A5B2VRQ0_9BACT|nr:histidine kinase [Chitinophaga agrisoli]
MRSLLICVFIIGVASTRSNAQAFLKTEYFGTSGYQMTEGDSSRRIGNSKGSAIVYQAGINIPLSKKLNELNRPTMWSIGVGGAYVGLNNKNFTAPLVVDKVLNIGVSLNYQRPLNDRWSLRTGVGGGIFMPTTDLSQIRFKNVLGSVSAVFIRHLKPNLDLGGGLALNNSFGFPMLFPAFYLNWRTSGRYSVQASLRDGLEVSAGYQFNTNFKLNLVMEVNGQMALLEQEGKDKIFTHQYVVFGLRPEIKLGKRVTIPLTFGLNATRTAQITDRSLKTIFQDKGYSFRGSLYAGAGLQFRF